MSIPQPERDPLADLLRQGSELDEAAAQRARDAFLFRADEQLGVSARSTSRLYWLTPLAAAAAIAATFFFAWPKAGLGYEVSGANDESGYVRVAHTPARILFSDATRLDIAPGSRLRIGETRSTGAHVSVEQGQLEAQVTHSGSSDWRFVAGPFQVHVTGTRFKLDWDAANERLEVVLHEGSVEVEGYAGSGPVAVRKGQRFFGDARLRRMLVTDANATEPTAEVRVPSPAEPGAPADRAALEPSPDSGSSAKVPAPSGEPSTSWAKLVSKGEFGRVVSEATARGTSNCLATCSAAELGALADAARYTSRGDLAEQSLLALHKRFTAASGARAAFLLGRQYESQGQMTSALTWYTQSLAESPNGSFAAESLAGKMRTVNSISGRAAAAPIAREYLQRYPSGVQAATARQLLQTP